MVNPVKTGYSYIWMALAIRYYTKYKSIVNFFNFYVKKNNS